MLEVTEYFIHQLSEADWIMRTLDSICVKASIIQLPLFMSVSLVSYMLPVIEYLWIFTFTCLYTSVAWCFSTGETVFVFNEYWKCSAPFSLRLDPVPALTHETLYTYLEVQELRAQASEVPGVGLEDLAFEE
jgi:hypothetical protein